MTPLDIDHLRGWIGKTEAHSDVITASLIGRFRATFGDHLYPTGDTAPLGLHWCLAPMTAPPTQIGADGHPKRGGFLPPVPLPSRMWAGGEVQFHAPLRDQDHVTRHSRITDVSLKTGKSGALVFVTVEHDCMVADTLTTREIQNIVYKDKSNAPPPAAETHPAQPGAIIADPVMLFRYSALTFNGHRIHYDRDYAIREEGYSGLVVHGPLQATLLMNEAAKLKGGAPATFSYRGLAPLIDSTPFYLGNAMTDGQSQVWCANHSGRKSMQATYS